MPPPSRFDPAVLAVDPSRRRPLLDVLGAALDAVEPGDAVRRALDGIDTSGIDRLVVVGMGKAALGMASGAVGALPGLPVTGVLAVPEAGPAPDGIEVVVAGHPVPDRGSLVAARRGMELVAAAGPGDLVLVLVSGGGSATFELPVPGVDLGDLVALTDLLLRAGAPIEELNTVRTHLSRVKGGGLAAAVGGGRLLTLVVSDVIGSPLDVIASGPTVAAGTAPADARDVLRRRGVEAPPPVVAHLEGSASAPPRRRVDQSIEVVADGGTAARAALRAAAGRGIAAEIVTLGLAGEAREVGGGLAARAGATSVPGMSIHAGETTVTVGGDGVGGRNQELALAAAEAADGDGSLIVAALGTDGVDGPTPAAGAVVDGGTLARGREAGLDAADHLARNDAHPYLAATGDLLVTGPTGTNVGDVVIVWRSDSVA